MGNTYYLGGGYHIEKLKAETFSGKYTNENGEVINTELPEFKSDLNDFLRGLLFCDEATLTAVDEQLLSNVVGGADVI